MRKGKHLGPHGFVDAVFLLALFDSSFGYIHDVGLGDALCRSSCGSFCASTYQKKGRKRGARAMAPLQVPHDNLLVMRLPEDFSDFSDSLATNEVSSTSIDQPCHSCFPVPLPRSAPLRPAAGHPHLFEFFFATTVTSLGGLCCPSWRLSRKPCARHRIFCSLQESNSNPRHCCRQRTTRPRNQQEGHVTRTLSLATAMWMLSSSEPRSIPFSETYMMSVWACIAPLVMSFVTLPQ